MLGKTTFRGSFEEGEIVRNPPDTVPAGDGFSSWFVGLGDQEDVNRVLKGEVVAKVLQIPDEDAFELTKGFQDLTAAFEMPEILASHSFIRAAPGSAKAEDDLRARPSKECSELFDDLAEEFSLPRKRNT